MTVTRHPRAAGVQRCRRAPDHEASHAPCGEVEHLKSGKSSDNMRIRLRQRARQYSVDINHYLTSEIGYCSRETKYTHKINPTCFKYVRWRAIITRSTESQVLQISNSLKCVYMFPFIFQRVKKKTN